LKLLNKSARIQSGPEDATEPIFPARVDGMIAHQTWKAWSQLSQETQSANYGNNLEKFIRQQGQAKFDAMPSAAPPDVQRRKGEPRRKK